MDLPKHGGGRRRRPPAQGRFPGLRIEPCGPAHRAAVGGLLHRVWHETGTHHLPRPVLEAHPPGHFLADAVLAADRAWVAWSDGALAGYCAVRGDRVHQLLVAPGLRRRGLGSRLLATALGHLRDLGFLHARAGLEGYNRPARAFFAAHGWDCLEVGPLDLPGGTRVARLLVGRALDAE